MKLKHLTTLANT